MNLEPPPPSLSICLGLITLGLWQLVRLGVGLLDIGHGLVDIRGSGRGRGVVVGAGGVGVHPGLGGPDPVHGAGALLQLQALPGDV